MEYRELKYDTDAETVLFSTDKSLLDLNVIHKFLSERSYWAKGVPLYVVERSVKNSLCVGIYTDGRQIGFARIITDYTTFGYLADVFVDENFRGHGISKKLMEFIFQFPEVKTLRRFVLVTSDAHGLYEKFGFKPLKTPERFMEVHQPNVYLSGNIDNLMAVQ